MYAVESYKLKQGVCGGGGHGLASGAGSGTGGEVGGGVGL